MSNEEQPTRATKGNQHLECNCNNEYISKVLYGVCNAVFTISHNASATK